MLLADTCSQMAFIPFVFTMPSHWIIYVSHHLSCGYSASELLLDRMGFCMWQRELFEVDDWCLPAVAVLRAGRERVMFSERHTLVWYESIRGPWGCFRDPLQRESDDVLSLRAQYPSSHVGYHVLQHFAHSSEHTSLCFAYCASIQSIKLTLCCRYRRHFVL